MKSKINVVGTLKFFNAKGELVREEKNLVVSAGLNVIASRLAGTSKNAVSHMAIGTGTTAANASDTALEIQKATRLAATTITVTANAIEIVATFPGTTHAGAITEAGLFNAATLGELISRVVFAPYTLGSSDALTITWTLTFANS
ncbi:MAG: hypothetical protein ACMV0F_00780 [Trichlorobacter sp.]